MLIRFCECMAALPIHTELLCHKENGRESISCRGKAEWLKHHDLFTFIHNPALYRAEELHGAKPDSSSGDQGLTNDERFWARKVSALEHVLSRLFVPKTLPLKVLIVENDFPALVQWNQKSIEQHHNLWESEGMADCLGYLTNCDIYVVDNREEFTKLRSASERETIQATLYNPANPKKECVVLKKEIWRELDLVLQDIMLDRSVGAPTGLHYTPYYLEACPQALVFVLTGMDVESLAMSSDIKWQNVDAVISKRKLGSLWWSYYEAFCRVFGRMFWSDFTTAEDTAAPEANPKREGQFGDRQSLRKLFRSLRQWQMEPAILGHGQGVAEMIDHAHRHITRVWRLTDDLIGTLMENVGPRNIQLDCKDRMLLALGVWLHDIGHRGNEFTDDSAEIRITHAGISEYLLLRNPRAYGVGWLLDYCKKEEGRRPHDHAHQVDEKPAETACLQHRNSVGSCESNGLNGELCPLRKVGLLCRHHQSNAPLTSDSLASLCKKGKFPSPYSRYQDVRASGSSQTELEEWMKQSTHLTGWIGSGIRFLAQFETGTASRQPQMFMALAGVLRMMDGLQIHRARVGTPASLQSFNEFLEVRKLWCEGELGRIDSLLCLMVPGSKEYLDHLGRRANLERYQRLVKVQSVHWWRQLAAHDVNVMWHSATGKKHWDIVAKSGTDTESADLANDMKDIDYWSILEIQYEIDVWGLAELDELTCPIRIIHLGKPKDIRPKLKTVLKREFRSLMRTAIQELDPWQLPLVTELKGISGETTERNDLLWVAHVAAELVWGEHESQVRQRTSPEEPYYLDILPSGVLFRISAKLSDGTRLSILDYLKR